MRLLYLLPNGTRNRPHIIQGRELADCGFLIRDCFFRRRGDSCVLPESANEWSFFLNERHTEKPHGLFQPGRLSAPSYLQAAYDLLSLNN